MKTKTKTLSEINKEFDENVPKMNPDAKSGKHTRFGQKYKERYEIYTLTDWANIKQFISEVYQAGERAGMIAMSEALIGEDEEEPKQIESKGYLYIPAKNKHRAEQRLIANKLIKEAK